MKESSRIESEAIYSEVVPAGDYWFHTIKKGQTLRILDMEGNQAADTLFYDASDPLNRYSASDTIKKQRNLYLTTGTKLISTRGEELLEIVADTCGRHDTVGEPAHARATPCATVTRRNTCTPVATVLSRQSSSGTLVWINGTSLVTSIFS